MPIRFLATAFLVSLFAAPVAAATLTLTATALSPAQNSNFTITFDDLDGDMRLDADEVIGFSGFRNIQLGKSYSTLLRISPVPDETDVAQTFTSGGFAINTWLFGEGADRTTAQPAAFDYRVAVVPLPAAALFLLTALGGLVMLRRT